MRFWFWILLLVPASSLPAQEVRHEDVSSDLESLYRRASERVGPSVVSIKVNRDKEASKSSGGMGALMDGGVFKNRPSDAPVSGTVLDADGWIVTSHFNVSGKVKGITVTLPDGRTLEAALKGFNATYDVALLKIDARDLPTLKRADLKTLKTGQIVAALGRAPDGKNLTVNQGIVSAPWRLSGRGIQVDARLNYGNAGGAIVDPEGRLIGIACKVDTKYSGSFGQNSGVGFAVTWDKLDEILPDLKIGKNVGEARKPFLGIQANRESEITDGVEVQEVVAASAADKVGVKPGDVLLEFDGKRVKTFDELRSIILMKQPGDRVKIKLRRDKEEMTLDAELGWAPGD